MNVAVSGSMRQSMDYIRRYKADLLQAMKATDLIPCEGIDEKLAQFLDRSCGIDYICIAKRSGVARGVGCRFQEDRFAEKYNTFTIRKERGNGTKTEFAKRKAAVSGGGLYPYLTLHAYVDIQRDRIDRLAIAKTAELIDYCENCNPPVQHTGYGQIGQADFYCIDWYKYRSSGRSITIWHNEPRRTACLKK